MIAIIDYGLGNLGSIQNIIKKVGGSSFIVKCKEEIYSADKVILPGVGSFDKGIRNLKELGYVDAICDIALVRKKPILGICLGMQLLTHGSEEGMEPGLGFINAKARKLNRSHYDALKKVHMGWNKVTLKRNSALFEGMEGVENRFYFVHSYFVCCEDKNTIITTTNYGEEFVSSFELNNIYGVQFHPEKSHKYGMKVFKNFVDL